MKYVVTHFDVFTRMTVVLLFPDLDAVKAFIKPDWHVDVNVYELGKQVEIE